MPEKGTTIKNRLSLSRNWGKKYILKAKLGQKNKKKFPKSQIFKSELGQKWQKIGKKTKNENKN